MNVINPESVSGFCAEMAGQAATEPLADWLRRNLRNHVMRSPTLHVSVSAVDVDGMVEEGILPSVPPWLPDAVARGDALVAFDPESPQVMALAREVGRLLDHYNSVTASDMSRVSYDEAVAATLQWEREQSRVRVAAFATANGLDERTATAMLAQGDASVASMWPESPGDTQRVAALPDGHALVHLLTKAALRREGALMDHCVETYGEAVVSGAVRILSLRSPGNVPLATLEVRRPSGLSMGIIARFLPKGLSVAVQVRGPHNNVPLPGSLSALTDVMRMAGMAATDRECRWLRLPDDLRAVSHLDVHGMAAEMPAIIRENGGGPARLNAGVAHALRILLLNLDALGDAEVGALASGLVPKPVEVTVDERRISEFPAANLVEWTVPNLMLTGQMSPLTHRAHAIVTPAFVHAARTVLDGMARMPTHVHEVRPSVGTWRDPLHFFAWCGLAREWQDAVETCRTSRRSWLDSERLRFKTMLRDANLDPGLRMAALNAVNVQIPRLLAGCQPPPQRPAPAPARKPPSFRLPTRPAPRRRA